MEGQPSSPEKLMPRGGMSEFGGGKSVHKLIYFLRNLSILENFLVS